MIVATTNKFTILKKLADDIAVLLQPPRPGSSLPAILIGLHSRNLFQALVALRLPADATKNVHLEVALAARRLALFNSLLQLSPMGVQPIMLLHVPVP